MTTLVTGGSGVVGRALLKQLVSLDRHVRALVRSDEAAAIVAKLGAHPTRGDLLDFGSLATAMDGCSVVYHVAGSNEMCLTDPSALFRVNVDGSRNTLRAAAAAGVRRLVYTSSATTLGEERGSVGDEWAPHRGWFLSNYERSKYEAEQALLSENTDVDVVVVNPSSVQGPGRSSGTGRLFLGLVNGKIPAVVDSRFSMIDIEDCAKGHILAEVKGVAGQRYVLSGFTLATAEAVQLLEDITGLRLRLTTLPQAVVMGGAAVVELGARLMHRRPRFCREMIRVLSYGHSYDGSRATRELGLEYTSARDTIQRTIEWFMNEGLVTRKLPGLGR
jgi:dihydroflavonol-4-reductase